MIDVARGIVNYYWAVDVASVKALPSYDDLNFLVVGGDGRKFVLKMMAVSEDDVPGSMEALDFENQAMDHLATSGPSPINVPRVVRTVAPGPSTIEQHTQKQPAGAATLCLRVAGRLRGVRLLTYVSGRLMADLAPLSDANVAALGSFLGSMDRALAGFTHPAAAPRAVDHKWNLLNAGRMRSCLADLDDANIDGGRAGGSAGSEHKAVDADGGEGESKSCSVVAVVRGVLDEFEGPVTEALAALPRSRLQVVHNDANDHNIIVDEARGGGLGAIDFGDMIHCYLVCNLAIAAAYACMGQFDPVETAASLAAAYHAQWPLLGEELDLLLPLVRTRLAQSLLSSARSVQEQPENRAYILVHARPAWDLMRHLVAVDDAASATRLRRACGLPGCASG
eukprot:g5490.t1